MEQELSLEKTLEYLLILANNSLELWDIPAGAKARLINVSENATYIVEAEGGYRSILRVHRENYHTKEAILSELAWTPVLKEGGGVVTPDYYLGRDGEAIQSASVEGLDGPRFMVLFEFVEGEEPDEKGDLVPGFEELGEIAANTHVHSISWERPEWFERMTWDLDTIFGPGAPWGDWRDAPEVDDQIIEVLDRVEDTVKERLTAFGKPAERYGLVHADMRLANLLVSDTGTRLIDFDDCGFSWFLYDFATGISFMEDDPRVPDLKEAWVKGYKKVRSMSPEEEDEIDTFVMMRRLALQAWIGSRIEAPEPQALAPGFAKTSAMLGEQYLAKMG